MLLSGVGSGLAASAFHHWRVGFLLHSHPHRFCCQQRHRDERCMAKRREPDRVVAHEEDLGGHHGSHGGKPSGEPLAMATRQPDRVERHRGSEYGRCTGRVIDRQQREREDARDDERRERCSPTHREDSGSRQCESERQWSSFGVSVDGDADDGDDARNDRHGGIEEKLMTATHPPNLALLPGGRVRQGE